MSSIIDSDVTYCSEAEELIKATCCVLKKSGENVAVRRSQRLSQTPKVMEGFSWNNVMPITKNGVVFQRKEKNIACSSSKAISKKCAGRSSKCTQDNFNRSELKDHLLGLEFNCKFDINTANDPLKMIKNDDVPLDLSHKFKVSTRKTSEGELDILKAHHELRIDKVKSIMEKAEETAKDDIIQKKKRGRPQKVRTEETCLIDNTKSLKLDKELESHTQTEKNKNELQDHVKVKKLHDSSKVPGKRTKSKQVPDKSINFYSKKSEIISSATKKLSPKYEKSLNDKNSKVEQSKTIISDNNGENFNNNSNLKLELQNKTNSNSVILDKTKENLVSVEPQTDGFYLKTKPKTSSAFSVKTKPGKTPLSKTFNCPTEKSSKNLKRSCGRLVLDKNIPLESKTSESICRKRIKSVENINSKLESQNKKLPSKSLKRSCGTLISNKSILENCENSNSVCGKRIKLSNENDERNNLKNLTKVSDNSESKPVQHLRKTKLSISQDIFEKFSNESQTIKRSQKTIQCDQSVGEHSSNELQNFIRYIKSEQLTPVNIYPKKVDESNPTKAIPKSLTINNNNKIFSEDVVTMDITTGNGQNKSTNIKSEIFSSLDNLPNNSGKKKSCKRSQDLKTDKKTNKLLEDNVKGTQNPVTKNMESKEIAKKSSNKRNQIKNSQHSYFTRTNNKLQTQNIQRNELNNHPESVKSIFKTSNEAKPQKAVTTSQQNPKYEENIAKKSKVETEKPPLNKNYLKSFDKTLFLDKLHKTTANHNIYEKTNLLQIPPTPADSTQELWKKSLLPENYPPHFKYQLPPEAALTSISNEKFQPINVITPDDTPASELLESSSSSPSLPESLCELFHNKHIKDILNVDKVSYRLYDYHVQALALTLNLSLEYLQKILDKIMKIKPKILKNIDKAVKMPFVPDYDLFAATPEEQSWASGEVVFNSQNSKKRRMSVIGGRI